MLIAKTKTSKKITLDNKEIVYVLKEINEDNFNVLSSKIFSEKSLEEIAYNLTKLQDIRSVIYKLILHVPEYNREYDWNTGSILRHIDHEIIIETFKQVSDIRALHDSIGLAWVFGEINIKDQSIINYLYSVIELSVNQNAWWEAAFSLEKLGVDDAINLLKRSQKPHLKLELEKYLETIDEKRSVISVLILSNASNTENIIYPKIKEIFLLSKNIPTLINCCWLIERLNLLDNKILDKLTNLVEHKNYELKHYVLLALQNNANKKLEPIFKKFLNDEDPLVRKTACNALGKIGDEDCIVTLEKQLYTEENISAIKNLTRTIYHLKNPTNKERSLIEMISCKNENGLISDESDKWYEDVHVYNIFSLAEDPQDICFDLINKKLLELGHKIVNPIDLATGTGRFLTQIVDKLDFSGTAYGVDISKNMRDFTRKKIRRERRYVRNIEIVESSILDISKNIQTKSSLVISSFGFPSKIFDRELCKKELLSVYEILTDDGIFITLGWDETFNDELNTFWFKYIPDNIRAKNFEDWRTARTKNIASPRNCDLTWFKRGLSIPLQFSSLKESATVMGALFGRDAAQKIISQNKVDWEMSLGITINTKKDLGRAIKHPG